MSNVASPKGAPDEAGQKSVKKTAVSKDSATRRGFDLKGRPLLVGLEIGAGILGLLAVGLVLWYIAQILLVFFAAIFLSVFFSGVGKFLEKRTRFGYPTCVAFTLIGLLQLIVLVVLLVGPSISGQFANLSDALPKSYHQILDWLKGSPIGGRLVSGMQEAMQASKSSGMGNIVKFAGLTFNGLGGILFALVIAIFLAFQPDLYRNGFLELFPEARQKRVKEVLDELGFTLWWWLMGQLVTMASVGILITLGLTCLGIPMAGTLGLIAAILSFIPSIGPLLSVVPALLLSATVSPQMALWVALLYLVVMTLESNVITPLVQRKAISLPPAFVTGSEIIMGLLLGGAGLAFATPLCAVILVLVNMLYIQDVLKAKGSLPSDASASTS
jgi:predicted PurR-regulated permease PerM